LRRRRCKRTEKKCDGARERGVRRFYFSSFLNRFITAKGCDESDLWCGTSDEFFVGMELAVFGSVMEGDVAVGPFFELIDFAGVERL
jgi:hypothetical protein